MPWNLYSSAMASACSSVNRTCTPLIAFIISPHLSTGEEASAIYTYVTSENCCFKGRIADIAALHGTHHVFQKSMSSGLPLYLSIIVGSICWAGILGSMSTIDMYKELVLAAFFISAIFLSADDSCNFKSSLLAKSKPRTMSLAILS